MAMIGTINSVNLAIRFTPPKTIAPNITATITPETQVSN